jgi:RNA polymerase sporulation-specific sigma factor
MSGNSKNKEILKLISEVRSGKEEAFKQLLDRYTPLIESSVSRVLVDGQYVLHADDLRQEATVVFYNSIMTYDLEQHEVEFGLYAKICISNALISQVRRLQRRNAERLSEASDEGLFGGDREDPSVRILEQESLKSLYSIIRGNLSEFEYEIWQLYTSGRTAKQIGEMVGKDEKSVANAVYRIRKKLRAVLHNNN